MNKIDLARSTASDVLTQWTGVDIDWSNVPAELDAHWADATEEPFTDSEFRGMVAREIQEWAKRIGKWDGQIVRARAEWDGPVPKDLRLPA